jgi:protein-S-isoprenylcysteine O-methyltransferase Ste14
MNAYRWVTAGCWLLFAGYWIIAAFAAKRSVGARRWRAEALVRVGLVVLIVVVVRSARVRQLFGIMRSYENHSQALQTLGVVLCALGTALALWARYHLGRNWGMPMSQKAQSELVVNGPYERVRHPIYGGLILMMLGSALGASIYWVLALLAFTPYFVYSARREEQLLCRQFPAHYPAYRQRTRMFWPCLI